MVPQKKKMKKKKKIVSEEDDFQLTDQHISVDVHFIFVSSAVFIHVHTVARARVYYHGQIVFRCVTQCVAFSD